MKYLSNFLICSTSYATLPLILILVSSNVSAGVEAVFSDGFEIITCTPEVLFEENFNGANQNNWGGLWQESGNEVDVAEVLNQEGRLIPVASNYALARMVHPLNERDVESTFSFVFEDGATQGIGFYVRSNGGYLQQTTPTGQGYAVFLERFTGQPRLGLWYENDGNEISFVRDFDPAYQLLDGIKYSVRFQVFQEDASNTRLRARVWQADLIEPSIWHVSLTDNFLALQNTAGSMAVDSWSTQTSGQILNAIRIDDIVVTRLCQ